MTARVEDGAALFPPASQEDSALASRMLLMASGGESEKGYSDWTAGDKYRDRNGGGRGDRRKCCAPKGGCGAQTACAGSPSHMDRRLPPLGRTCLRVGARPVGGAATRARGVGSAAMASSWGPLGLRRRPLAVIATRSVGASNMGQSVPKSMTAPSFYYESSKVPNVMIRVCYGRAVTASSFCAFSASPLAWR